LRKFLSILCLCLFIGLPARAQLFDSQASSGSVYSSLGVGVPIDLTSSSALGIGVPGVSFVENNVPGLSNPAIWGDTFFSMATGGLSLQKFDASDRLANSQNTTIAVDYFQLQLPLKKNSFGISLSLAPITKTNFQVLQENSRIIGSGSDADTISVQTENRGDGGINSLELGFGWRLNKNISIGYAGSLVYSSIENEVISIFEEEINVNEFQNINFSLVTSGVGFGNRFGTLITFPGLFSSEDRLNIGAAFRFPINISGDRIQESDKQVRNQIETIEVKEGEGLGKGDIKLPMSVSGGITYQPNDLISFIAEGLYEQWSDFEYDFDPNETQLLDDRMKVGAGIRFFPYRTGSDKFFSGFKYRLGVSYDNGHLKISNRDIETLLFSAGLGILSPNVNSNSSIDISVQYGIRGSREQGLVKENFWGVQLSINLAELMFFRRKLQ